MNTCTVNTEYSFYYIVKNAAGTGQAGQAASVATQLVANGAVSSVTVTVTEVSAGSRPGWYRVSFTPNATGVWACLASHATYDPGGWLNEVQALTAGTLDAVVTQVWTAPNAIDSTLTPAEALMYIYAATVGQSAGEPSDPATFKGPSGTVRLTITYDDSNNRITVTRG